MTSVVDSCKFWVALGTDFLVFGGLGVDLKIDDFSKLKFKDFYLNHQKYMRIKDYDNFLNYISN